MKSTRHLVQFAFLVLVLAGVFAVGANCERWCPFGGVEALYTYVHEGDMVCSLGVSNFFILGGVLLMTVLVRRAFCSYMCPLGAISEWVRAIGRKSRVPEVRVPPGVDRVLSLGKYVLLAVVLWFTWRAGELIFRGFDPCYALISRHGTDITVWAYVVSASIVAVSLAITLPFCRWFCPLAAVLNPFSRFALARVQRDADVCLSCGVCADSCPVAIPVDQLRQVTAARCMSCLNCVEACPHNSPRALSWGPPRPIGRAWTQPVLIALMLACTFAAVAASYAFPMPSFVKVHGEPPDRLAVVELEVEGVSCRGRANLFFYYLERDDMYQLPGYLKAEAWPGPQTARIRIVYDPLLTDEAAIKRAVTEPYYDVLANLWRMSQFRIEGYNPLELDLEQSPVLDKQAGP